MTLSDKRIDALINLIKDSFRVRPNHTPIYVDVGGHLSRVGHDQHQVIFGRRGSGKSCLLVHYKEQIAKSDEHTVYIDTDEIKRLSYPDVLIRLVLALLEGLPGAKRSWWHRLTARRSELQRQIDQLRDLLDQANQQDVTENVGMNANRSTGLSAGANGASASYSGGSATTYSRMSAFKEQKLDELERHLQDYKKLIVEATHNGDVRRINVIVDDFYLIVPVVQADVVDYLHRLTRGTNAYLKIGTVRHRTSLTRYENGQTIGVELNQDIEPIDLDRSFEHVDPTHQYLRDLLTAMGSSVGIENAPIEYLTPDGLFRLTLASGGVPRDYLNIFVDAVPVARRSQNERITPTAVFKSAASYSYQTKLRNLRNDLGPDAGQLERVFQDLLAYCLQEKRKTAFLISQGDAVQFEVEHELIKQLMDFKLIHVVEPDTSAASGRLGRFEAYTLDFALFMEPRKRNIDIVEFWKVDAGRRKLGIREAPTYSLERVREVIANTKAVSNTEQVIEAIVASD